MVKDILELPRNSAERKVNEFVKRARLAKVYECVCACFEIAFICFAGECSYRRLPQLPGNAILESVL